MFVTSSPKLVCDLLASSGHELVEETALFDRYHRETGPPKRLEPRTSVSQEVDGSGPGGLAGSFDACGVVGPVAISGLVRADLVRPDDIGVAVPRCTKRVHEGEIPPPPLDEHHVPEQTPVMQYRCTLIHVAGHGLDGPASSIIRATVVRSVSVAHA